MPRDFFRRSTDGSAPVAGTTITDIQAALNATGIANIAMDGIYGRQTSDALKAFQSARGQAVTGNVSDETWRTLIHTDAPRIFERSLQVVAAFEGTGFDLIEGNFDGAGLTWGIIGFTLADGELGSVLNEINHSLPGLIGQIFGADAETILKVAGPNAAPADRLAFANSISGPAPQFRVAEPWRTFFSDLGRQREVQRIQIGRARDKYWADIALRDATDLDMREELDLLLLFDVAVQNGGMRSKGRLAAAQAKLQNGVTGEARRKIVAAVVANTITGPFHGDVVARKQCIASGAGTVHKSDYVLASWGFLNGEIPPTT